MHTTPAFLGSLYYISEWAVRLVMLVYVPQRRTAAATRTWLLLIFLLPWPRLVIYAVFGRIRVEGPVVAQLEAVFLIDWFLETNQRLDFGLVVAPAAVAGATAAQVLPSGPGYPRENTRDLFITLLYAARTRVVITTPYFIPDEPFLQAIRTAAARGVAVHLVVSKNANQPISQFAQRAYYEDLLAAGVHIHLYRPRFLHAKHISIDDQVAVFGSTNIDIRSFALNAEASLVAFDPAVVGDLVRVQERYFANSDLLDAQEWSRRPLAAKVAQNVARLADSLL